MKAIVRASRDRVLQVKDPTEWIKRAVEQVAGLRPMLVTRRTIEIHLYTLLKANINPDNDPLEDGRWFSSTDQWFQGP